ncbi:MAG: hypothetical protein IT381_07080 [Deltaproteobacteria bacterium]|nr:hypothetical protein [Deltaproteobacteria bacterium]
MTKLRADDATLNRLLAGDPALSADESDAILERVVAPPPKKKRPWFVFAAPLAIAASAAALIIAVQSDDGAFSARGKHESNLRVACHVVGGEPTDLRCAPGEGMRFELEAGAPYFAAFVLLPDGSVSWVIPQDEAATSTPATDGWLAITAAVDAQPGTHVVHGVFSKTPLTRAQIRAAVEAGSVELVTRKIEVK